MIRVYNERQPFPEQVKFLRNKVSTLKAAC